MIGLLVLILGLGGKPVSVAADREMDDAAWIAEATVVADGERLIARITTDPDRVFKGFERMGAEVELTSPTWGPEAFRGDLGALTEPVLVVARKDGVVPLVGARIDGAYLLRSWCDYNAWWIYSTDKEFGEKVEHDRPMSTLRLKPEAMATRYEKARAPFNEAREAFLAGREPDLTADELADLVRRLGADEPADRDAAAATLVERGCWSIGPLRDAAADTRDPEVRTRIELVLRAHAMHAAAYDAAVKARPR